MSRPTIGDTVRILVDRPNDTSLQIGDLVTVIGVGIRPEFPGGPFIPVAWVSTASGSRCFVHAEAVEPVQMPVYTPAEPDELYDAFFEKIMRSDLGLHAIAIDAHNMLGDPAAVAKHRSEEPDADEEIEHDHDHDDAEDEDEIWKSPKNSHFTHVDSYDGRMDVIYAEHECQDHGREGAFFFKANGETSVFVAADKEELEPLIQFLVDRFRFSKRPEGQ